MKNLKHLILPAIVGVVLLSSCSSEKKDFICSCADYGGFCGTPYETPINGKTKKDAKAECASYNITEGEIERRCSLK